MLGALAALRQNTSLDYAVVGLATFGITTPNFVVAPLLSLIFGVLLGWLPAGGWSTPTRLLGAAGRHPRAAAGRGDRPPDPRLHDRGAALQPRPHRPRLRAAGPGGGRQARAARRDAAGVSYLGPTAAGLLTGSVVVETIFGIPGIGRYFVQGALGRDYTLVMGTVVVIAVFIIVFNLIVDLLYAWLDPRVRYD
jgi:oligopeptide transport system permease protein